MVTTLSRKYFNLFTNSITNSLPQQICLRSFPHFVIQLGTWFWFVYWIMPTPLKDHFPILFSISIQQSYIVIYIEICDGDSWQWELTVMATKSPSMEYVDSLIGIMNYDTSGSYNVKSFVNIANPSIFNKYATRKSLSLCSKRGHFQELN